MELTMRLYIYCTQVELCGTRISELNGIDNASFYILHSG